MKRTVLILVLGLGLMLAGCSGVIMTAEYSAKLDETAALSAGLAEDAALNRLDPNQMKTALKYNADAWACFQSARDAKTPKE